MFDTAPASIEYLKSGKLRPLAVTTRMPFAALPDVPVLADFVPGYESSALYGIAAPKNTSPEIVAKLNEEINAALSDPSVKARLTELGGTALPGSSSDFGKLIADETEKWARVVKLSGAKPD